MENAAKSGLLRGLFIGMVLVAATGLICSTISAQFGPSWFQSGHRRPW